ncbi:MAG: tetratricopeptide repeat protein, partial [Thermoanaerobaculia bacterium]
RALKLAPDFYEAQLNRGIALQMSGDANAASEQFQALLRTLPGDRRYERQRDAARRLLSSLKTRRQG